MFERIIKVKIKKKIKRGVEMDIIFTQAKHFSNGKASQLTADS